MSLSINQTLMSSMSPEQAILYVNNLITIPSLIILFIFIFLVILVVSLFVIKGHESRMKILKLWFISIIISIIGLVTLILTPLTIHELLTNLLSLFN